MVVRKTLLGVTLALAATSSQAQTDGANWTKCKGYDPDASISGCSALIQSGLETKAELYQVYWFRSAAYMDKNLYDLAVADASKGIELNPRRADLYIPRGIAYGMTGRYDLSTADFSTVINLEPDSASGYEGRGIAYQKQGLRHKAISDFRAALIRHPNPQDRQDIMDHLQSLGAKP